LVSLLKKGQFFKIICGGGNEDPEEVKRLSIIYTLAGAKGIDISANPGIVKHCMNGIDYAYGVSEALGIDIGILARQTDVRFNGISVGSYARAIVEELINHHDFYNVEITKAAVLMARKLIKSNMETSFDKT